MAGVAIGYQVGVSTYVHRPRVTIRFRVTRDGQVTPARKVLFVFSRLGTADKPALVMETLDGELTVARRVDQATLLANGAWLVIGNDDTPPQSIRAALVSLGDGGLFPFDIASGSGGGSGDPAVVPAIVRVDGDVASREIVIIERPTDGEWRVAGYGPTPGGAADISVRTVGGDLYAVGLDDFGLEFSAGLSVSVGQRVRPTVYSGWLYEITEPGVLPSTEPEWWAAQGDNASRPLGTARAIAVRYYRPLAHGPLPRELIE